MRDLGPANLCITLLGAPWVNHEGVDVLNRHSRFPIGATRTQASAAMQL